MMKNSQNNKIAVMIMLLVGILILIGTTYAYFIYSRAGKVNVIRAGKLEFALLDGENVHLASAFPVNEEKGLESNHTDLV